jgi:hypothetical protein
LNPHNYNCRESKFGCISHLNLQTIVFNQVWIASPISILKTVVLNQSSDFISHFNPQTIVFESSSGCSSPFQFSKLP